MLWGDILDQSQKTVDEYQDNDTTCQVKVNALTKSIDRILQLSLLYVPTKNHPQQWMGYPMVIVPDGEDIAGLYLIPF